jgi:hypothetical protein
MGRGRGDEGTMKRFTMWVAMCDWVVVVNSRSAAT